MKTKKARIWIERLRNLNRVPAKFTPKERQQLNGLGAKPSDRIEELSGFSSRAVKGSDGVWRQL